MVHFPVSSGTSCGTVKARKLFPLANRNIEPKQNKYLVISVSASWEHVLLRGVVGKHDKKAERLMHMDLVVTEITMERSLHFWTDIWKT